MFFFGLAKKCNLGYSHSMPKLTKQTEAGKILQAMQVLQLTSQGWTVKDACSQIGISPDIYNRWLATGSDVIERMQENIVEAERVRLAQIVNAQAIILSQLLTTVSTPSETLPPDPDMQLKVLKYLDTLRKDLETKHGVHSQTDLAKEYAMQGPSTRTEESQMAVSHELSRSVVNIKTKPDGSVDLTIPTVHDVVDLYPILDHEIDEDAADGDFLLTAGEQ